MKRVKRLPHCWKNFLPKGTWIQRSLQSSEVLHGKLGYRISCTIERWPYTLKVFRVSICCDSRTVYTYERCPVTTTVSRSHQASNMSALDLVYVVTGRYVILRVMPRGRWEVYHRGMVWDHERTFAEAIGSSYTAMKHFRTVAGAFYSTRAVALTPTRALQPVPFILPIV